MPQFKIFKMHLHAKLLTKADKQSFISNVRLIRQQNQVIFISRDPVLNNFYSGINAIFTPWNKERLRNAECGINIDASKFFDTPVFKNRCANRCGSVNHLVRTFI